MFNDPTEYNPGDKIRVANPLPENAPFTDFEGRVMMLGPHAVSYAPAVVVKLGEGIHGKVITMYADELELVETGVPVSTPIPIQEPIETLPPIVEEYRPITIPKKKAGKTAKPKEVKPKTKLAISMAETMANTAASMGMILPEYRSFVAKKRYAAAHGTGPTEIEIQVADSFQFEHKPIVAPNPLPHVPHVTDKIVAIAAPELEELHHFLTRYQR